MSEQKRKIRVPGRKRLSADEYLQGILAGNRSVLSRAITLVESSLPRDRDLASELLEGIMPHTGGALRLGLTGVPGVGKSTFIDSFGSWLTSFGKKIAVLAVDPSSTISGGSILGDKTRMESLSMDPLAFIRPSPAGGSLGGVTRSTREALLLCEAAGFDLILVETVGVGQSEIAVHSMVDFFLLLMLPGAGDELQGIKKGIVEMADAIVINKADGSNQDRARMAQVEYANALRLFPPSQSGWKPSVLTCSALNKNGLPEVWKLIAAYQKDMTANGYLEKKRQRQSSGWMRETIGYLLEDTFFSNEAIAKQYQELEKEVIAGKLAPTLAAQRLVRSFFASKP